jgi:DNA-binding MarR family transcriptional regulator
VVRILGRSPGRTAGELARAMCVHPSTLTGVLRRLEARGLVERRKDASDGRKSLFVLTPTGRKLDGQQAGTVEAAVRRSLGRLPSHELDTTRKVLEMLSSELSRPDR